MAPFANKVNKPRICLCVSCTQNPLLHTKVYARKGLTICPQAIWQKKSELFYIASKPDELAAWADALRTGQDPRKKTGNVVAIQADRFFLRRGVKSDVAAPLSQYAKRVAKTRMAVAMQGPTSAPDSSPAHLSAA